MVCAEWMRQYEEWLKRKKRVGGEVKKGRVNVGEGAVPGRGTMEGGRPRRTSL